MDPLHEHLARVGLAVGAPYGFALAGGYAMQHNGFLVRPSEDVDLFTIYARSSEFDTAVDAIIDAYRGDGFTVTRDKYFAGSFARLYVSDGRVTAKVELGTDWRAHQPIQMDIGPVLHPDDAVAAKMSALWGRAIARDFIDIYAALMSGSYGRADLLRLAADADSGFDLSTFAAALGRLAVLDDDDFAPYGVRGRDLADLRARFAEWRQELLDGR